MAYTPKTWGTGDRVRTTDLNHIEQGIANAGGGKYDAYDYIIKQVDSNTPTLEKGSWQNVYDALQDMKPVVGLFIKNTTPSQYHDAVSLFIPITYTFYYSSADMLLGTAITINENSSAKKINIGWAMDGTISVSFDNL